MSGKQMGLLVAEPDGDEEAEKGTDLETLDALSRKIILAVQKSDEKSLTDAIRTFVYACHKSYEDEEDEEE